MVWRRKPLLATVLMLTLSSQFSARGQEAVCSQVSLEEARGEQALTKQSGSPPPEMIEVKGAGTTALNGVYHLSFVFGPDVDESYLTYEKYGQGALYVIYRTLSTAKYVMVYLDQPGEVPSNPSTYYELSGSESPVSTNWVRGSLGASPAPDVIVVRTLDRSYAAFLEHERNNGSIADSPRVEITLVGDRFTGTNGEDFVTTGKVTTSNVPDGLTMRVIKIDDTNVRVTLSGSAVEHAAGDGTDSLLLQFENAAFNKGSASGVLGSSRYYSVRFDDAADVSFTRYELYQNVAPNATENPENIVYPGATVRLKVQARNQLESSLLALKGTLRVDDSRVTIVDSVASFNNIMSGNTGWSGDEYEVAFSSDFSPGDGDVWFTLIMSDEINTDGPWRSSFSFPVAPFAIQRVVIDDDAYPDSDGNDNDTAEVGETIELVPVVQNMTDRPFESVFGTVTSANAGIAVWNGTEGASGTVYDTYAYNMVSGVHQTIAAHAEMITPVEDFVLAYQSAVSDSFPLQLVLSGYRDEEPGASWDEGGILMRWGQPLAIPLEMGVTPSGPLAPDSKLAAPHVALRRNALFIAVPRALEGDCAISIFDAAGACVMRMHSGKPAVRRMNIPLETLPAGMYFVEMRGAGLRQTHAFHVCR